MVIKYGNRGLNMEHRVIHTEGDFFQCQNYVLQLLSEKEISQPAFILYCFYKSTAGFSQINYSYEYISTNTGISKGAISKGIVQLEEAGLVEVTRYGANKTFDIKIVPGSNLPRRVLKAITRKGKLFDSEANPDENFEAQEKKSKKPELPTESMKKDVEEKFNKSGRFDPMSLSSEAIKFWEHFTDEWKRRSKTEYYPKNDMYQLKEIENFQEATRLIPVMWVLGEVDDWTRDSDHTLSVFVHLLKCGKLLNYYPKTSFYYKDKEKDV